MTPSSQAAYQFDSSNNLAGIVHVDAQGDVIDGFTYSYNANGQLTSESDFSSNGLATSSALPPGTTPLDPTTNYAYDASGQLISAGSTNYTYDANGNRINSGYVIGPDNQILSDGTWNYTYDNVNCLTSATELAANYRLLYNVSCDYE